MRGPFHAALQPKKLVSLFVIISEYVKNVPLLGGRCMEAVLE